MSDQTRIKAMKLLADLQTKAADLENFLSRGEASDLSSGRDAVRQAIEATQRLLDSLPPSEEEKRK